MYFLSIRFTKRVHVKDVCVRCILKTALVSIKLVTAVARFLHSRVMHAMLQYISYYIVPMFIQFLSLCVIFSTYMLVMKNSMHLKVTAVHFVLVF